MLLFNSYSSLFFSFHLSATQKPHFPLLLLALFLSCLSVFYTAMCTCSFYRSITCLLSLLCSLRAPEPAANTIATLYYYLYQSSTLATTTNKTKIFTKCDHFCRCCCCCRCCPKTPLPMLLLLLLLLHLLQPTSTTNRLPKNNDDRLELHLIGQFNLEKINR